MYHPNLHFDTFGEHHHVMEDNEGVFDEWRAMILSPKFVSMEEFTSKMNPIFQSPLLEADKLIDLYHLPLQNNNNEEINLIVYDYYNNNNCPDEEEEERRGGCWTIFCARCEIFHKLI